MSRLAYIAALTGALCGIIPATALEAASPLQAKQQSVPVTLVEQTGVFCDVQHRSKPCYRKHLDHAVFKVYEHNKLVKTAHPNKNGSATLESVFFVGHRYTVTASGFWHGAAETDTWRSPPIPVIGSFTQTFNFCVQGTLC